MSSLMGTSTLHVSLMTNKKKSKKSRNPKHSKTEQSHRHSPGPGDYKKEFVNTGTMFDRYQLKQAPVATIGKSLRYSMKDLLHIASTPGPLDTPQELHNFASTLHKKSPRATIGKNSRDMNKSSGSISPGPALYNYPAELKLKKDSNKGSIANFSFRESVNSKLSCTEKKRVSPGPGEYESQRQAISNLKNPIGTKYSIGDSPLYENLTPSGR